MQKTSWAQIEPEKMNDLITRQMVNGENATVSRLLLARGAVVPRHSHVSEQYSLIFSGNLKFIFDDREVEVKAGEVLYIPANVPHSAVAMEDTVDLDFFAPRREDWIRKEDAYLRQAKTDCSDTVPPTEAVESKGNLVGRRFRHLNREWDVELTGVSHGVSSGVPAKITSWGVWFRPTDDQSVEPFYGSISRPDPAELSDDDLRQSLETALVTKALEDPNWDWRTVRGVVQSTGLSEERVRELLESSTSMLRSILPGKGGKTLYTTRQHYKKRRSFLDSLRTG